MSNNIEIRGELESAIDVCEAGTPRSVAGITVWRILKDRHETISVRATRTGIAVRNQDTGQELGPCDTFDPPEAADPSQFQDQEAMATFLEEIRLMFGTSPRLQSRIAPMKAFPPKTFALASCRQVSDHQLELDFSYNVSPWK